MRYGWVVAAIALSSGIAFADRVSWAPGATNPPSEQAATLFSEGDAALAQKDYKLAVAKYRDALALWEHPLIRFKLATAEIKLDLFVEAAEDVERALRWGQGPLSAEQHQEALAYQRLLASSIGKLELSCDQPGLTIHVDGKPWTSCPGSKQARLPAGPHQVVIAGAAYRPRTEMISVIGGTDKRVMLTTSTEAPALQQRWATWVPWAVVGGGAAVLLGGIALSASASSDIDRLEEDLRKLCGGRGCTAAEYEAMGFQEREDRAFLKDRFAIGGMVVGGGAVIAGVVMAVLNIPKPVEPALAVSPTASGTLASVTWRF